MGHCGMRLGVNDLKSAMPTVKAIVSLYFGCDVKLLLPVDGFMLFTSARCFDLSPKHMGIMYNNYLN